MKRFLLDMKRPLLDMKRPLLDLKRPLLRVKRFLLGVILLSGCVANSPAYKNPSVIATPSQIPTKTRAQWTLIFYFAADNDLEETQLKDLEELTHLANNPQIHVLALMDRSPLGENNIGYSNRAVVNLTNWSNAKLLEVGQDKLTVLEDWGRLNMADPQTLRHLLIRAQESYPAQHYALFLVDHGQGWQGICGDESAAKPHDALDPQELQLALKSLQAPLDLLVFDACLMSSLEVYQAVSPYAHALIASQDSLPGQGLEYLRALRQLQARPESDGVQLGSWFLEAHRNSLKNDEQESARIHLALLDSRAAGDLALAWEKLSKALQPLASKQWLALAKARSAAQSFHIDDTGIGGQVEDLGQLLRQIRRYLPQVSNLAINVEEQLDRAVIEQVRGRFRQDCSGLSVDFPALAENLTQEYITQVESLLPEWLKFLKIYTNNERHIKVVSSLSPVTLSGGGSGLDLRARLGRPDQVSASYTILVHDHRIIGQMTCAPKPGSNLLSDYFDGNWLMLSDGAQSGILAQLDSVEISEGVALAQLSCQLKAIGGGAPQSIQMYFPLKPEHLSQPALLMGVKGQGGLGVTEVKLKAGDQLFFLERDLRPGREPVRGPTLTLSQPQQLQLTLSPIPGGNYHLGFLVLDLRGNASWQTQPLLWDK